MMDREKQLEALSAKLDPKHIKPAPKGKYGDYIEGHHAITEANRIFRADGWSYTIDEMRLVSEQSVTIERNGASEPQHRVGYYCAVTVEAMGVKRCGAAVGSGMGKPDSMADHHESAVKEAETDALKRALRTFGNPFGLALYDKTKSDVGVPERTSEQIRDDMIKALGRTPAHITRETLMKHHDFVADYRNLDEPHKLQINAALDAREPKPVNDPAKQAPDGHQYQ